MNTETKKNIKKLTISAVFCALSVVFVLLVHFPIFPSAAFLEYDPGDVPVLVGTLALGPYWGLAITAVTCVVQGLTVSQGGGVYGVIMHLISTGALVAVTGFVGRAIKSKKHKLWGSLLSGSLIATAVMAGANLVITPLFMGVPVSAVAGMLLPVIIPFNLIKLCGNALLTFVLWKLVIKRIKGFDSSEF